MNRPKNSVLKSKSSNSAVTSKSEPGKNKKSRSNAEIQPLLLLKKRGVYVANKPTKLSVKLPASNKDSKKLIKAPPIPRPNKKRFVNSVLNILSKSTAGTQHPEVEECSNKNRRCERIKFKSQPTEDEYSHDISTHGPSKKKQKYRSKILNDHKNDLDKLVILQSRKELVQTPSSDSHNNFKEPETIKWSEFLPPLVNNKKDEIEERFYDTSEGIAKHVLEGQKWKQRNVKLNEKDTRDIAQKEDKGLYNFFVDLLETTFSIYNVKPDYDGLPIKNTPSSNIALEIDESVAKRLNFDEMSDDITQKPSKHFCCVPETSDWLDLLKYVSSQNKISSKRSRCSPKSSRKLNTRSFIHTSPKLPLPRVQSFTPNSKKSVKNNTKKELLDSIKKQLRMDANTFEEPQNLFQALKLMASNKRKYRKSIHFKPKAIGAGSSNSECVLKRRKVISFSTKASAKKSNYKPESDAFRSMVNNYSDKSSTIKRTQKSNFTLGESEHSLEVYGFDFESIPDRKDYNRLKRIELTCHSSPTQSTQDFYMNDALMKYSESSTSSVQNYVNWNHGIQSVTKVIKQL